MPTLGVVVSIEVTAVNFDVVDAPISKPADIDFLMSIDARISGASFIAVILINAKEQSFGMDLESLIIV